jgi:hypothetical protein
MFERLKSSKHLLAQSTVSPLHASMEPLVLVSRVTGSSSQLRSLSAYPISSVFHLAMEALRRKIPSFCERVNRRRAFGNPERRIRGGLLQTQLGCSHFIHWRDGNETAAVPCMGISEVVLRPEGLVLLCICIGGASLGMPRQRAAKDCDKGVSQCD